MRSDYILIDFENVHSDALLKVDKTRCNVIVFVGANQTKIPFELASALQHLGNNGRYIKISSSGPNALDFHIAFYIGEIAATNPDAHFYIISNDTGFDALIAHLKTRKISVIRKAQMDDISGAKAAAADTPAKRLEYVVESLKSRGTSRPRKVETLSNTINSMFQKQLKKHEIEAIIAELKKGGFIEVRETKVTYSLPEGKDR